MLISFHYILNHPKLSDFLKNSLLFAIIHWIGLGGSFDLGQLDYRARSCPGWDSSRVA